MGFYWDCRRVVMVWKWAVETALCLVDELDVE